jgi:outer membrane protein OmpA-like peptidoglycan-associated protein
MRLKAIKTVAAAIVAAFLLSGQSDGAVTLSLSVGETYTVIERYNLSRYEGGKYVGHVYRETRAIIEYSGDGFDGDFYVLEETTRDLAKAAAPIDRIVPARFRVDGKGYYTILGDDTGFPDWRDFPLFPKEAVRPGDRWRAYATITVDPARSGIRTRIKVYVEYEYSGVKSYAGRPSYFIKAKFATRYKAGADPDGDPNLLRAEGTHDAEIVVDKETGELVIITDSLTEEYAFSGGKSVKLKGVGFIIFKARAGGGGEEERVVEDRRIAEDVRDALEEEGIVGIEVSEGDKGVTLTLNALLFQPDSDLLLPGEAARLDGIASALKAIATGTFLVEGHTADVGMPEHEADLSRRRAKRIVDELVARGIPAERFMYVGWGATRPVAPNDTEEHRAMNRRVEITILPDR